MRREPEIEQLVASWFDAASRGDASLIDRHVAPGSETRLIGSDPDELLEGGEAVMEFLRGEVEGGGGQATFTPSGTEAFSEGDVGWATTMLTITLADGRHVSPRWSAVFIRSGGVWQFVQTHASIGVRNDEVGWQYS